MKSMRASMNLGIIWAFFGQKIRSKKKELPAGTDNSLKTNAFL